MSITPSVCYPLITVTAVSTITTVPASGFITVNDANDPVDTGIVSSLYSD